MADAALGEGLAPLTQWSYSSHVNYFLEFCQSISLDMYSFGALPSWGGLPPSEEETVRFLYDPLPLVDVLVLFPQVLGLSVVYAVYRPRRNKSRNTAAYAESCLSGVLGWLFARHGRRPGPIEGFSRSHALLLRGLHKASPSVPSVQRLPILSSHVRALRGRLNLTGCALYTLSFS